MTTSQPDNAVFEDWRDDPKFRAIQVAVVRLSHGEALELYDFVQRQLMILAEAIRYPDVLRDMTAKLGTAELADLHAYFCHLVTALEDCPPSWIAEGAAERSRSFRDMAAVEALARGYNLSPQPMVWDDDALTPDQRLALLVALQVTDGYGA